LNSIIKTILIYIRILHLSAKCVKKTNPLRLAGDFKIEASISSLYPNTPVFCDKPDHENRKATRKRVAFVIPPKVEL